MLVTKLISKYRFYYLYTVLASRSDADDKTAPRYRFYCLYLILASKSDAGDKTDLKI